MITVMMMVMITLVMAAIMMTVAEISMTVAEIIDLYHVAQARSESYSYRTWCANTREVIKFGFVKKIQAPFIAIVSLHPSVYICMCYYIKFSFKYYINALFVYTTSLLCRRKLV